MNDLILVHSADVCHHGVKGQSWGKRQYQYEDGSLTPLGREHYGVGDNDKKARKVEAKLAKKNAKVDKLYSKAYDQEVYGMRNLRRNVNAYNKSVNEVNEYINTKLKPSYDKQLKKQGIDTKYYNYGNDPVYAAKANKKMIEVAEKKYNSMLANDMKNNKYYQKAEKIISKYGLNERNIKELLDYTNDNNRYDKRAKNGGK